MQQSLPLAQQLEGMFVAVSNRSSHAGAFSPAPTCQLDFPLPIHLSGSAEVATGFPQDSAQQPVGIVQTLRETRTASVRLPFERASLTDSLLQQPILQVRRVGWVSSRASGP